MEQVLRLLTLEDSNTRTVLLGTGVLGVACGVIGSFAVLRRRALMGDAVAHAALPGVAIAYMVVGERSFWAFMVGALVLGVLASASVSFIRTATRVKEDAAIALAISGFFGVGIVLSRIIQNRPGGNRAGLDSFIFGKAASMTMGDAWLIAAVAAVVLGVLAVLYKEFKLLCFDQSFAASLGRPALGLDLLLMGLICVCTVVGLPAVGVVLMVSLLIIPAVAARFWTQKLAVMLVIAGVLGGASGVVGTALSATLPAPASVLTRGWPTGPLITLVAAAFFVVSMLLAPRRGVVAELVRRAGVRRRVQAQHVLRAAYEHLESAGELGGAWSAAELGASGAAVFRLARGGLVEGAGAGAYRLTGRGQEEARRVVRAHRLWELFLIRHADIAPDHVDRDADMIEHVLPAETIAKLEEELRALGRGPLPESPHPLDRPTARRGGRA